MTTAHHRAKQILIIIILMSAALTRPVKAAVVCNQLIDLAPEIIRFLVHPTGSILAAQTSAQDSKTCISFYAFQKSNTEGRPAKLTQLSQLNDEDGQGFVYDWAKQKYWFAFGTPQGKIAAYALTENEDEEIPSVPVLLGTKQKISPIKGIAWSQEGEHLATITGNKLIIYSINLESRKRPIQRTTSIPLDLNEITFLQWSHDDSFIVAGNSKELFFWKTRTASGNIKLISYSNKELETALRTVSGPIKDIGWNRTGNPTLAILNNKLTLITLPRATSTSPINMLHNFSSGASSVLSWNSTAKGSQPGSQELIISGISGKTYQVYTMTDRSLMFDTTNHELLPPFNRGGIQQEPALQKSAPAQKHILSETSMLELVNKLVNKPQDTKKMSELLHQ